MDINECAKLVAEIMKKFSSGDIDLKEAETQMARRVLDIENLPVVSQISMIVVQEKLEKIGIPELTTVLYVLSQRVVRLEDDVRVLRGELAKERVGNIKKRGKNE